MVHVIIIILLLNLTLAFSCVLVPLITISQPVCVKQNCASASTTNQTTRGKRNAKELPLVKIGSPNSLHFQSVHDDNLGFRVNMEANIDNCDINNKYRNADGSCNNVKNGEWGMSNSPFLRILYPSYSSAPDGARLSVSGNPLPLPRYLSTVLFPHLHRPWYNYTLSVMQWGQLLAHDSGLSQSATQLDINCCLVNSSFCYPIIIPEDDKFYSKYNQTCINMIRIETEENMIYNCMNIKDQINVATGYIDLSFLYGNNYERESSLRNFENGLLEPHLTKNFRQFPKLSDTPIEDCNNSSICFYSGDLRINQNTQLTCLMTVLFREHNRIASELSNLNSNWTDETVFQETKNILIAIFQHISYKEWMPLLLGGDYMTKYNLYPLENGYTSYRNDIQTNTLSAFMAGAYRIFHSQIKGLLTMYNYTECPFSKKKSYEGRCPVRNINISDYMNSPAIITVNENYDELLLGLTVDLSQNLDRYFTTEMTEKLFRTDMPYGEDLESFDIQRGREFGLPSYNSYRVLCNLTKADNFSDLTGEFTEKNIQLLQSVYEDVEDIDLFVGCVMENWVEGTSVGPTTLCIIGEEFVRKKFGDRFWYEVGNMTHSFTPEQLEEIRKSSYSRLLCDNSDNITTIQPNSFLPSSVPGNAIVPCSTLPALNLTKWKVNS